MRWSVQPVGFINLAAAVAGGDDHGVDPESAAIGEAADVTTPQVLARRVSVVDSVWPVVPGAFPAGGVHGQDVIAVEWQNLVLAAHGFLAGGELFDMHVVALQEIQNPISASSSW